MWRARLLAKVLDSDTLASKEKDKSYSYGSKRQAEGLRRRGATSGLLSFSKALSSMSLLVSSALCYGLPYMPPPLLYTLITQKNASCSTPHLSLLFALAYLSTLPNSLCWVSPQQDIICPLVICSSTYMK